MSEKIREELEAANKRLQILRRHQGILQIQINELEAELEELEAELEAAFDDEAVLIKDIEKMERYLKEQS